MPELLTAIDDDGVATVTLDAPERRNALTIEMVDEIVAALDRLEADGGVRALVVTGTAPAFCAGADLAHLGASQREGLLRIYEGFLRFARSPLPTVAAVNGAAVGAGVNLALTCDVILAAESARFVTGFLKLGLHPGGGMTWMLERRVGAQAAAALAIFGETADGRRAAEIGLAWRCVPDGELLATARTMAASAAAAPAGVVRRVKETLADVAALPTHAEAVERELEPQVWSINQPEFAERLAAMQQRISQRS
jgi:enoyl-CoA hydratase